MLITSFKLTPFSIRSKSNDSLILLSSGSRSSSGHWMRKKSYILLLFTLLTVTNWHMFHFITFIILVILLSGDSIKKRTNVTIRISAILASTIVVVSLLSFVFLKLSVHWQSLQWASCSTLLALTPCWFIWLWVGLEQKVNGDGLNLWCLSHGCGWARRISTLLAAPMLASSEPSNDDRWLQLFGLWLPMQLSERFHGLSMQQKFDALLLLRAFCNHVAVLANSMLICWQSRAKFSPVFLWWWH